MVVTPIYYSVVYALSYVAARLHGHVQRHMHDHRRLGQCAAVAHPEAVGLASKPLPRSLTLTLFRTRTRTRTLTLILALAPTPTPTLPPTRWDLPRLYALAGSMCLVVTAAQLLFLGIGFAAMRPAAQQPDRLNLFWYVRRTNPNP